MAYASVPLRDKVRAYPGDEDLSNEATRLFFQTFKETSKAMGAQPGFVAAKRAVEALPKDRRYRKEGEEPEEQEGE